MVGEQIRQLPTIAPPADFRSRVFAAIREEERRVAPAVLRLSREATNPSLPVVRSRATLRQTPRRQLAPRFALAAAAVLAVALLGARMAPLVASGSFGAVGASLNGARQTQQTHQTHVVSVSGAALGHSVGAAVAAALP